MSASSVTEQDRRLFDSLIEQALNVAGRDIEGLETSFRVGEEWRQARGASTLVGLLSLADERINSILGIEQLPPDFHFVRDWLTHTREAQLHTEISGPAGSRIDVIGLRIQNNVVDRCGEGERCRLITPVGGGVRVTFVPGELVDVTWRIKDLDKQMVHLRDECSALATTMVPKNLGLDFTDHLVEVLKAMDRDDLIPAAEKIFLGGGAKGDIIIALLENMGKGEQNDLVAQALFAAGYEWGKQGVIGPFVDRLAGDVGTTIRLGGRPVLEWVGDGYIKALEDQVAATVQEIDLRSARAVVTGKLTGGLEAREDATGLGTWESLKAYAELSRLNLSGKSVFFRGCGSAAKRAIIEAANSGMRVTAIADLNALVTCNDGFTAEDARVLSSISLDPKRNIADWARQQPQERGIAVYAQAQSADRVGKAAEMAGTVQRYWQEIPPDVIFESATQMTLNQNTADSVPDRAIIVEGGNGVTTPIAAIRLQKKEVVRIPGINCNSGGVFVSWFEWAQDILGVKFPPEAIAQAIAKLMRRNMEDTLNLLQYAREHDVTIMQDDVFYALAMARGLWARGVVAARITAAKVAV